MTLVGHKQQIAQFLSAWRSDRMPHAWLLTGPKGVGKRQFADQALRFILADAAGPAIDDSDQLTVADNHPIARLIEAGSHMDMRVIEREIRERTGDLAPNISIDQIRQLHGLLQATPVLSPWRAVIVDSVDDLARPAANALLKNLEEPPPATVFLLVSHAPGRLLPTIRSRCHLMRFTGLSDADTTQVIQRAQPDLAEAELASLTKVAQGAPGQALRYSGLEIHKLMESLSTLAGKGRAAHAIQAELAKSLSLKAAQPRYEAFLELAPTEIARHARQLRGRALAQALTLWEKASDLAASAVPLSLDPQSVVFELAGMIAALDLNSEPENISHG